MIHSQHLETPSTVASHYDDLDEFYREIWGMHVHHGLWETGKESSERATELLLERLLKGAKIDQDTRVCDIGCGYGETARYLASKFRARVTGYSVSGAQLTVANHLKKNENETRDLLDFKQEDWCANQLESESFDLLLSIESSEHMPSIEKFFSEAYRVLKPGGQLRICAWLSKEKPKPWETTHLLEPICTEGRLRLCTPFETHELIREAGFKKQRFEEITDQVKKTWSLCLIRTAKKVLTDFRYIKFLMRDPSRNKAFLKSLFRIRMAYETRSMLYGIFVATK